MNSLVDEIKHEFPQLNENDLHAMQKSVNDLKEILKSKTGLSEPRIEELVEEKMEYINSKYI